LSACNGFRAASSSFTDDEAVTRPVGSVRIENGSGEVKIRVGGQPNLHRKVYYVNDKPEKTHHYEGDVLVLDDCRKKNCSVDYDVVLPAGAKVIGEVGSGAIEVIGMSEVGVRAGSGDIVVRDVPGPVTVNVSSGTAELSGIGQNAVVEAQSGDIRLVDMRADVTVLARSGNVDGARLFGRTSVESSSGDVNLDMAAAQDVKVSLASGNLVLRVPRGDAFTVSARTRSGANQVDVATDPAGKHHLDLDASSGDITVSYR
jgi:DUF4097 and DUF4098 domain-containing protein YvlB